MKREHTETIYFAGGCFWCTEAIFTNIAGVHDVTPGYIGGNVESPSYEQVTTGATGHAEAVAVVYDAQEISVNDLLEIFFDTHDPTTLNRQGADIGTQYRSAIFYTNDAQKKVAEKYIKTLQDAYAEPIVTELKNSADFIFYPAEDYHKDYFKNNSEQPYCQIVISPKLEKLQKLHGEKLGK